MTMSIATAAFIVSPPLLLRVGLPAVLVLHVLAAASTADAFFHEQQPRDVGRQPLLALLPPLAVKTRRRRPPRHLQNHRGRGLHHGHRGRPPHGQGAGRDVLLMGSRRVEIDGLAGWVTSGASGSGGAGGAVLRSASASDGDIEADGDNDGADHADKEDTTAAAMQAASDSDDVSATNDEDEDEHEQQEQEVKVDNDFDDEATTELRAPTPSKIDNLIRDLHSTPYPFRIVVVGNGAILETTSRLGPYMNESTSPKTGERLITLASDDRTFEFHLKVDSIGKVMLTESKKGTQEGEQQKTLRIVRMMREGENSSSGGGWSPICSLILAESSEESARWFRDMTIRYGYEVYAGD
mmetsp:Transcript_28434/g.63263  ORF Transcript_28434/g.63263 Transcript_28434/m.63263 type:complete len:353 (+) Transcript_28434:32-1090(+)